MLGTTNFANTQNTLVKLNAFLPEWANVTLYHPTFRLVGVGMVAVPFINGAVTFTPSKSAVTLPSVSDNVMTKFLLSPTYVGIGLAMLM